MKLHKICVLLVISLFPFIALAGSFEVRPLKVFLDARTGSSTVRLVNHGEEAVTVQVEAVEWRQEANGKDIYSATKDILFFPKIFTFQKEEEAIIRVNYRGMPAHDQSKTYRLFVQELPVQNPGAKALKMTLSLSIPVFVAPAKISKGGKIAKLEMDAGKLHIYVTNTGNSYIQVKKIEAKGIDGNESEAFTVQSSGWYVLPGATRLFALDLPAQECAQAVKMNVAVQSEVPMERELEVDKNQCH